MPKKFTSEKQKTGEIGENITTRFLVKHKFTIKDRNYTKKWGEIDIVAEKDNKIYFIEVKSISKDNLKIVSQETLDQYRPEDNMHPWKMKRIARTIQSYILENQIEEKDWQVDLFIVFLDLKNAAGIVPAA